VPPVVQPSRQVIPGDGQHRGSYRAGHARVIKSVSFDAADALALARFWAAALGPDVDEHSTAEKAFAEAAGWGGPNIWFTRVPQSTARQAIAAR